MESGVRVPGSFAAVVRRELLLCLLNARPTLAKKLQERRELVFFWLLSCPRGLQRGPVNSKRAVDICGMR